MPLVADSPTSHELKASSEIVFRDATVDDASRVVDPSILHARSGCASARADTVALQRSAPTRIFRNDIVAFLLLWSDARHDITVAESRQRTHSGVYA